MRGGRLVFIFVFVFIFIFLFEGCSSSGMGPLGVSSKIKTTDRSYHFVDTDGEYLLKRKAGEKQGLVFVDRSVENNELKKVVESSRSYSQKGTLAGDLSLRPKSARFEVWFDKKLYVSVLKLNEEKKSFDLYLKSPEKKWNGKTTLAFPDWKEVTFCFYSQILECAKTKGFLQKAGRAKEGVMPMGIIWDGFPYLSEQYPQVPKVLFSKGTLRYDGRTDENEHRFSLDIGEDSVVFVINSSYEYEKQFWVVHGISIMPQNE